MGGRRAQALGSGILKGPLVAPRPGVPSLDSATFPQLQQQEKNGQSPGVARPGAGGAAVGRAASRGPREGRRRPRPRAEKAGDKVAKGVEEVADMRILRTLAKHLWPEDNPEYRRRVVGALGLPGRRQGAHPTCLPVLAVAGGLRVKSPAPPLQPCGGPARQSGQRP